MSASVSWRSGQGLATTHIAGTALLTEIDHSGCSLLLTLPLCLSVVRTYGSSITNSSCTSEPLPSMGMRSHAMTCHQLYHAASYTMPLATQQVPIPAAMYAPNACTIIRVVPKSTYACEAPCKSPKLIAPS